MRKILVFVIVGLLMTACCDTDKQLRKRAFELCGYVPDHQLPEKSKDYLTTDFYVVLDTMFNHLPSHEALDHEWLYYFVTGNGGTIADFDVAQVVKTDRTHAVASINVRQVWEDGSYDPEYDLEEHTLLMEKVNGQWLMSDFDGHKADCIRYIEINRQEQAVRQAVSDYLIREIGVHYLQGQLCIPVLLMVREEDDRIWGDFWIEWYNISGDTLKTVSGGNHSGVMTLTKEGSKYTVTSFEQTVDGAGNEASARRIFGDYFDIYQNMHSNQDVREAVRREQLSEYLKAHNLPYRYYQDYGWPAVKLFY